MEAIPHGVMTSLGISRTASMPGAAAVVCGVARLPSDPIGSTTVTFSGVPTGSEIRVYDIDKNELAGVESCVANQTLSWPIYAQGSPYNTVRVVIVGLNYRVYEFQYTAVLGNQNIPILPDADRWYLNP